MPDDMLRLPKIVHLERDAIRALVRRPAFPHQWEEYARTERSAMAERLQGAEVAIVNKLPVDAELLAQLPDLKLVAVAATGTNNIDLAACYAQGIQVCNIRGYAVTTVPEHVLAMMLALSRNLFAYRQSVAEGVWQAASQFCFFDHPIRDLAGQTLGIVGSGGLGQGVARLGLALGMRVVFALRKEEILSPSTGKAVRLGLPSFSEQVTGEAPYMAFSELLAQADVLSLHCPLNDQTRDLIGEAELRAMKSSALLINTARGGLVNEKALARALREGWIAGAGFDVLTEEPPKNDNPLLDPELLGLPNFLLTPHVAWASAPAMQALADQLIDNIEGFYRGEPRNLV